MLDIKYILENKEEVIKKLNSRGSEYDNIIEQVISEYEIFRKQKITLDENNAQLNDLNKQISLFYRDAKNNQDAINNLKKQIETLKKANEIHLDESYLKTLLTIPNVPCSCTPIGQDENDNIEIKKWGEIPQIENPQAHDDLVTELDFAKGAKLSKSRFVVTFGIIAKLERALANFMLDEAVSRGYKETTVPYIVSSETLIGSGQLPKFADDLFKIAKTEDQERDFYLIPTAEAPLANLFAGEIIHDALPLNYTAFSQCFRSEAGSAGRDTKGLIRMHQFGKVELFKYVDPEDSNHELEKMLTDAENILQKLNLPYRVMQLCTGDLGFSAKKTYDLEVWMPSQNKYRECSSCSRVADFQARRNKTRFKKDGKNIYPHMLNGSGMATGRILAAIIENYQKTDGTFTIPEVLKPYM